MSTDWMKTKGAAAGGKTTTGEKDEQVESVQKDATDHILEDGEHVSLTKESDNTDLDMKLATSESIADERTEAGKDEGSVTATPTAVTDLDKKRRRAERFGTDFKISEAEKRKLRAARFNDGVKNGAAATEVAVEVPKPGGAKVPNSALADAESAKRKARAERFGTISQEAVVKPKFSQDAVVKPKFSQDEEAKKKARMARFAMAAK